MKTIFPYFFPFVFFIALNSIQSCEDRSYLQKIQRQLHLEIDSLHTEKGWHEFEFHLQRSNNFGFYTTNGGAIDLLNVASFRLDTANIQVTDPIGADLSKIYWIEIFMCNADSSNNTKVAYEPDTVHTNLQQVQLHSQYSELKSFITQDEIILTVRMYFAEDLDTDQALHFNVNVSVYIEPPHRTTSGRGLSC